MTTPSRRHFIGALSATALASAVALPAGAQLPPASAPVVIGTVTTPDMAALLYARSQNAFTKAGIALDVQTFENGGAMISAAAGGSVQIGYANSFTLIQAFQRGIPVRLIAPGSLYTAATPGIKLLVAGDSKIASAKDLIGKTIGVSLINALPGLAVTAWLAREGVDPASVKFFESPPNLMVPALQQHRVDAIFIFDPFLSAAEAAGAKSIGTPFDAIARTFVTSAWFTVTPWVTDHHPVAKEFASIMSRSGAYANTHYKELVPMLADFSKIPAPVLAMMLAPEIPPSLTPAMLQPVIDTAAKFGNIPAPFKAQDMILPGLA